MGTVDVRSWPFDEAVLRHEESRWPDNRPHITLRMKTARQIAEKSGQTVHVYYNEQTKQYQAYRLYSKREDDSNNDEPKEE